MGKVHQIEVNIPNWDQGAGKVLQQTRIPVANIQAGHFHGQLGTPQKIVNYDPEVANAVIPSTDPLLELESVELELSVGSLVVLPLPTIEEQDREQTTFLWRRTRACLRIVFAREDHIAHPDILRV